MPRDHCTVAILSVESKTYKFLKSKHIARMCGCINTLKHKGVSTTLRLAYHGCKNLAHTSKTSQVKRTQMVAAARITIHVFVAF